MCRRRRSIVARHIEGVAAVLLIEDESSHTIVRARAAAARPVINLMPMLLLFSGSFAFGCVTRAHSPGAGRSVVGSWLLKTA